MRESFEKARDEKLEHYFRFYETPEERAEVVSLMVTGKRFADWAYEWCQENGLQVGAQYYNLLAQLDQQAKIIAELKGALKEASKQFECITYNTHNSYCVEELANDANEEIKQVIKQTDKPDEV